MANSSIQKQQSVLAKGMDITNIDTFYEGVVWVDPSKITAGTQPFTEGYWYYLIALKSSTGMTQQIAIGYTGSAPNIMKTRHRVNNAWTPWGKFYGEKDVVPVENGGTGATTARQAVANLGLGTYGQGIRVYEPNMDSQSILFQYTVKNPNYTRRNGHLISLVAAERGWLMWDETEKAVIFDSEYLPQRGWITTGTDGKVHVTFPIAYTAEVPQVFANANSSESTNIFVCRTYNITKTGFDLYTYWIAPGTTTVNPIQIAVSWYAVGN